MKTSCERVRPRLPHLVDGTLPGWRRRLVQRHVDRCEDCAAELERQQEVSEALRELGHMTAEPEPDPPDELLEAILARVHDPGIRERVAAPARGAVSGARPGLSVTAVLLSALVVYLAWRVARALVDRLDTDG